MCGLYGFTGKAARMETLRQVAKVAMRRGGDAFGVYHRHKGRNPSLSHRVSKHQNPVIDMIDASTGANFVIGHARMATCGSAYEVKEAHPFHRGRVILAHNGILWNDTELAREHGVRPKTSCDTEVLALICAKFYEQSNDLVDSVRRTIELAPGAALLVTAEDSDLLVAGRHGNPLVEIERPEGLYLCSTWDATDARPLPADCVTVYRDGVAIDRVAVETAQKQNRDKWFSQGDTYAESTRQRLQRTW